MSDTHSPLALSAALTTRTNALALGLEHGAADLLELVTPTTAELLLWWFGEDMVAARSGLKFKAERDEAGNPALSEGQRVMLRAGLQKLRKLEADFAAIDPTRHPKMLVVCEDTTVSPLVAQFLQEQEGLQPDEVMTIDSGKKAELGEKDWAPVRQRLFSVDKHATPRVIVSVLMLREGFDVNNICVIVPLRSSQAQSRRGVVRAH